MPCLVATANEVDPVGGRLTFWKVPASFAVPDDAAELLTELAAEHPLIRHATATGDGSAWRISDFWSQDMFHASRLHRADLYGPMGVEYQMSATLPAVAPVVFGLVVSRANRRLQRSRSGCLERAASPLGPGLAQFPGPGAPTGPGRRRQRRGGRGRGWNVIVLWDPPDELAPGALVTLYRFFGRPSRTSPLPARVDRWIASQQAHLAEHEELKLIRPLTAQLGGQRIVLRYLPAQGAHPGAIIVDEERQPTRRRDYESLGLSPWEAEITELAGARRRQCCSRRPTARGPGHGQEASRQHLRKAGVRSRGQLTAFVLHLVDS